MELSDLVVFRTVVEAGGVTRAASRLHRVQSNVTTRVKNLEAELGVALFIREGRRMQLTPAGKRLLARAVPIWRRTHRELDHAFSRTKLADLRADLLALSGD